MAPASRSTRSGRPGGAIDHELVDGLPIRQWRLQEAVLGTDEPHTAPDDPATSGPGGWPELPMPKGSEHYAPWCIQLLRAARAGKLHRADNGERPRDEEKKENEHLSGEPAAQKTLKRGFAARRWTQVPRHLEEPKREYLAKRRKGMPPLYAAVGAPISAATAMTGNTGQMRRTKVRWEDGGSDAQGWGTVLPESQVVKGEINDRTSMYGAGSALIVTDPGTLLEGTRVATGEGSTMAHGHTVAPIRRRVSQPRRRPKKGPNSRRRKKTVEAVGLGVSASVEALQARKQYVSRLTEMTGKAGNGLEVGNVQRQQAEGQEGPEEQEQEDDDDGNEDGDDGEEDDNDDDREEGEITPSPEPQDDASAILLQFHNRSSDAPVLTSEAGNEPQEFLMAITSQRDASGSPELPLASSNRADHVSSGAIDPKAFTTQLANATGPAGISQSAESATTEDVLFEDGEVDLLGSMDKIEEVHRAQELAE